jgi:glutathione-specific gamma-glutamylcyclotransferase
MLTGGSAMWVFSYGSLMEGGWARQLGCAKKVAAELRGYRRVFNKKSSRNWSSSKHPCPTLNIEEKEGVNCHGIAFEFPDENEERVRAELREREGKNFPLRRRRVWLNTGDEVDAWVPSYKGDKLFSAMSLKDTARLAHKAKGRDGCCLDYVNQIAQILSKLGINDSAVTELEQAVRAIKCQKSN